MKPWPHKTGYASLSPMMVIAAAMLFLANGSRGAAAKEQVKQVGPVTVVSRLTPDEPTIGDEITLEIEVQAEPQVEVLMPEFGEALDRYTILDFVPAKQIRADGSQLFSQRYTLQPYLSGEQSIPPILVEFVDNRPGQQPTPEDYDAYEILTDRIDFQVKSVLPENASDELRPHLGELELVRERTASRWLAGVLLAAVLLIAGALPWIWKRWRRQRSRKNAYQIARHWLDQLVAQPPPQTDAEVDAYFVQLSSIVRRYLEDRFERRAPDLTTEEFLELAGSASDLSREHQSLLRDFLRQADLVKFAGVKASLDEIQRSTELASRFLEETRENAPLVDQDESEGALAEEAGRV